MRVEGCWHVVMSLEDSAFLLAVHSKTSEIDTNCVLLCGAQEFLNGIYDCQKQRVFLKAPSSAQSIYKTIPPHYINHQLSL